MNMHYICTNKQQQHANLLTITTNSQKIRILSIKDLYVSQSLIHPSPRPSSIAQNIRTISPNRSVRLSPVKLAQFLFTETIFSTFNRVEQQTGFRNAQLQAK